MKVEKIELLKHIRTIPNYPKEGIFFRDITPLFGDGPIFQKVINDLSNNFMNSKPSKVIGIEARGFILASAVAFQLGIGFVPVRKKGKLPYKTISEKYDLEYGKDELEIHEDSIQKGERVIIIDDLIATGGTLQAAINLLHRLGGELLGVSAIIDLPDLGGSQKIKNSTNKDVYTLCEFSGH